MPLNTNIPSGDPWGAAVKAGIAATCGAGIIAAATMLGLNGKAMLIVLGGVVAVVVLVTIYKIILRVMRARRSAPFARMVRSAASGTPNAITQPAQRAALDDLRRSFDAGVAKFQSAGKDIYSLPW